MVSSYPDPSTTNQIDFYQGAFRIKTLLRRRGLQNVEPMNGEVWGFMPPNLYKEWSSFNKRQKLVRKRNGGREFERFVAQIISQYYCNPATFANKILDLSPGGDYDILAEGSGEALFHFETKTSTKRSLKSFSIPGMWNFLVRESRLGADMTVFILDANFELKKIRRAFEILFSLAEHITYRGDLLPLAQISSDWLLQGDDSRIIAFSRDIDKEMAYLFYPVLIMKGGDNLKKNIGEVISLYYNSIRRISPFSRLSQERTGNVFSNLPHWDDLPREVKKAAVKRKIKQIVGWS